MSVAISNLQNNLIIERFKTFYRKLSLASLEDIDSVYAPHILFRDPVHEIRGIDAMHSYFVELCQNLESCRFEYLDEVSKADTTYIKWDMHFRHPRVSAETITVRGMSQIKTHNDLIVYHEDVYDLGAMLYDHLPLLGNATRWLKKRLSSEATAGSK